LHPLNNPPGLFSADEQSALLDAARPWLDSVHALGNGQRAAWAALATRAACHVHIVVCLCSAGGALCERLQRFPALLACAAVDYVQPWSPTALQSVAERAMQKLDLVAVAADGAVDSSNNSNGAVLSTTGPRLATTIAKLCVEVHSSVESAAQQLEAEGLWQR
jgi:P-loop containing dynein motor region D4